MLLAYLVIRVLGLDRIARKPAWLGNPHGSETRMVRPQELNQSPTARQCHKPAVVPSASISSSGNSI
jgi:hypothetical protein